ncbi:hypothetical protein HDU98_004331, partial [Podochytrium sp. JEL0797]
MPTSQPTSTTYTWSPTSYQKNASFVPTLGASILETLAPQPHERILDLGCGDGVLTQQIAQVCGMESVIGVDASAEMIERAKEVGGAEFRVLDGHDLDTTEWATAPDSEKFDAVFSNAALHWMKQSPTKVLAGIHKVLKPNGQGRLVAEMGGFLNCGTVHSALIRSLTLRGHDGRALSPWFFPSPAEYEKLLLANGFTRVRIVHVGRPTMLPESGLKGWLDTFAMSFMDALGSDEEREEVKREIVEELRPVCCDGEGTW